MVGQLTAVTLDLFLGLFHLYLLSPHRTDHLHGVFEDEDGVEDGDGGEAKVDAKEINKKIKNCSTRGNNKR